jgi:hypothetical protein
MQRGRTEAETCRLNGWSVGTRLAGDEGYGVTIIRITAIGEESILARAESHKFEPVDWIESTWTLQNRSWYRLAEDAPHTPPTDHAAAPTSEREA